MRESDTQIDELNLLRVNITDEKKQYTFQPKCFNVLKLYKLYIQLTWQNSPAESTYD